MWFRYDHLAKVLINIFDYRPREAVDIFEALSLEAKKKMTSESDESLSQSEIDTQTTLAQIQKKIFKVLILRTPSASFNNLKNF